MACVGLGLSDEQARECPGSAARGSYAAHQFQMWIQQQQQQQQPQQQLQIQHQIQQQLQQQQRAGAGADAGAPATTGADSSAGSGPTTPSGMVRDDVTGDLRPVEAQGRVQRLTDDFPAGMGALGGGSGMGAPGGMGYPGGGMPGGMGGGFPGGGMPGARPELPQHLRQALSESQLELLYEAMGEVGGGFPMLGGMGGVPGGMPGGMPSGVPGMHGPPRMPGMEMGGMPGRRAPPPFGGGFDDEEGKHQIQQQLQQQQQEQIAMDMQPAPAVLIAAVPIDPSPSDDISVIELRKAYDALTNEDLAAQLRALIGNDGVALGRRVEFGHVYSAAMTLLTRAIGSNTRPLFDGLYELLLRLETCTPLDGMPPSGWQNMCQWHSAVKHLRKKWQKHYAL